MFQIFRERTSSDDSEQGFRLSAISHIGKVRENNEDNLCFFSTVLDEEHTNSKLMVSTFKDQDQSFCVGVFDGLGGEAYGEKASYLAACTMRECIKKGMNEPVSFLKDICLSMNDSVFLTAQENDYGIMGTTAALLLHHQGKMYCCNVGDSRIFGWRPDGLEQVSIDHTTASILRELNLLDRKPQLTQYIGINEEYTWLTPAISAYSLNTFPRYLLCSDGLTDMLNEEEIHAFMAKGSVEESTRNLLEKALERGGKDNITIILCEKMEGSNHE